MSVACLVFQHHPLTVKLLEAFCSFLSKILDAIYRCNYIESYVVFLTCWCVGEGRGVVAQLLSLLAPAVDPDAEAHEDDPAGSTDACDERRLLDHIGDLLRQTHAALLAAVAGVSAASAAWHGGLFSWQLWGKETGGGGRISQEGRTDGAAQDNYRDRSEALSLLVLCFIYFFC